MLLLDHHLQEADDEKEPAARARVHEALGPRLCQAVADVPSCRLGGDALLHHVRSALAHVWRQLVVLRRWVLVPMHTGLPQRRCCLLGVGGCMYTTRAARRRAAPIVRDGGVGQDAAFAPARDDRRDSDSEGLDFRPEGFGHHRERRFGALQ